MAKTTSNPQGYGPALGNAPINPLQDFQRIVQNIHGLTDAVKRLETSVSQTRALNPSDLLEIQQSLQAAGSNPLNVTGLPGIQSIAEGTGISITVGGTTLTISIKDVGPGAGTYTVGSKLTPFTGDDGTITINNQGQITAIQEAT